MQIELTRREKQTMDLLSLGKPNKTIADIMRINESTVKNHLHNAYIKLGVRNRVQAVLAYNHRDSWLSLLGKQLLAFLGG